MKKDMHDLTLKLERLTGKIVQLNGKTTDIQ